MFFKDFYLYIHERHRDRQRHRQRGKQAPCREPDAGFNPRTPGSHPEPKADAQPLSHPGVPPFFFFFFKILFIYLRERAQAGGAGEGEVDSSLSSEPDTGLSPRTPGIMT